MFPAGDTAPVAQLLERVAHVPVVYFGDLAPNGVRIYVHRVSDDRSWAGSFHRSGAVRRQPQPRAPWPSDLDLSSAPVLVHELSVRGLWLEQERTVLDSRL
jgi:hypothetical protein